MDHAQAKSTICKLTVRPFSFMTQVVFVAKLGNSLMELSRISHGHNHR